MKIDKQWQIEESHSKCWKCATHNFTQYTRRSVSWKIFATQSCMFYTNVWASVKWAAEREVKEERSGDLKGHSPIKIILPGNALSKNVMVLRDVCAVTLSLLYQVFCRSPSVSVARNSCTRNRYWSLFTDLKGDENAFRDIADQTPVVWLWRSRLCEIWKLSADHTRMFWELA